MAHMTEINLKNSIPLKELLEFGKDYCSDHFGRFFQNKYSLFTSAPNKFEIPAAFAKSKIQTSFAICVVMNNHILELKHFSDIFIEWDEEIGNEGATSKKSFEKINRLMNDQRLLLVIKKFKKINDEILIGRCKGREFTPFQ
jgi:hypothetical protein